MSFRKTARGFAIHTFRDRYNADCSIQKSSLAFEEAIWFGVDDPQLIPNSSSPNGFMVAGRMHLTQQMVRDLLPILQTFAETGELQREEEGAEEDKQGKELKEERKGGKKKRKRTKK